MLFEFFWLVEELEDHYFYTAKYWRLDSDVDAYFFVFTQLTVSFIKFLLLLTSLFLSLLCFG